MTGRTVVLVPAPTANGDLHVGHLAGPFLASDVHARYARAVGREVLYSSGLQDSQTYVVTSAHRLGTTPAELAARSGLEVPRTLAALGISVDAFGSPDDRFEKLQLDFLETLHAAGKFRLKSMLFPYSPRTGDYLMDGYVRGGCPTCLADGCGGVCETCGHLINPDTILDPRSSQFPDDPLERRPVSILVLPLEEYRDGLEEYFRHHENVFRPLLRQTLREMLDQPLPDFPITYPTSWGIPAPFPEVPGQTINPATEAMPIGMYSTALAAQRRGIALSTEDEPWRVEDGSTVAYFCGFDNIQPFAVTGIALLMAHGDRYRLPDAFVTNEFYELDHQKVSTSRGHVVWGHELVEQVPRDLVRYFLAASSPEHQRTNFGHEVLARVTDDRLVQPWNRIVDTVDAVLDRSAGTGAQPVSDRARTNAQRTVERFAGCYRLEDFSLNRAAATLAAQLARLAGRTVTVDDAGDFFHEVEVLLRCAAPILIDLAAQALPDTAIRTGPVSSVVLRRLPRLTGRVA